MAGCMLRDPLTLATRETVRLPIEDAKVALNYPSIPSLLYSSPGEFDFSPKCRLKRGCEATFWLIYEMILG